MEIPGSFKELLANKPALIGLAAAGGLGLFVFLRRRSSGATGGGSASTATSGSGGAGGIGTFDSTGTDIASFLGDFSSRLDTQLGGYVNDLKATNDALLAAGQTSAVQVAGGSWVKSLLEQVGRYKPGFSESDLQNLNPGLTWGQADAQGFISPSNPADPGTLQNVFTGPALINIPRP